MNLFMYFIIPIIYTYVNTIYDPIGILYYLTC